MESTQIAPANPATCSTSGLAGFLSKLADTAPAPAQQRLHAGAEHLQQLAAIGLATPAQHMEIRRLCQHPLLPRPRKTLVLVAYMRYDYDEAANCIKQLLSETSALDDMRDAA